jgi:hypothetical protein
VSNILPDFSLWSKCSYHEVSVASVAEITCLEMGQRHDHAFAGRFLVSSHLCRTMRGALSGSLGRPSWTMTGEMSSRIWSLPIRFKGVCRFCSISRMAAFQTKFVFNVYSDFG